MKMCPGCGKPIDDEVQLCESCLAEQENESEEQFTIVPFTDESVQEAQSEEDFGEGVPIEPTEEQEEQPAEEKPAEPVEEMTMAQRIRKYQIIPDTIDDIEDEPKPKKVKKAKPEKEPKPEREPKPEKEPEPAKAPKPEKAPKPVKEPKPKKEKPIKPPKPKKNLSKYKGLIKPLIILILIAGLVVTAVIVIKSEPVQEKLAELKEKKNSEQVEETVAGNMKWLRGKKYSSDYEVLKADVKELKDIIEKSLRANCTSEYNTLKEHYFGTINGTENYEGYQDSLGVGIIFEFTEEDKLIKNIYVLYDVSSDASKGETLISEYTACILNALGEIQDLSYQNINVYASSIRTNNFASVATHTRYNSFVLTKYSQENLSALIINHGSDSDIKRLTENEVLEIVNCADEKYLTEEPGEPEATKPADVTELDEPEVYTVKTAGDPLRIRNAPSTDGEILGTFESGTQIEVFAIADGWAKIYYNNEEAWLSANYIEKAE